MLELRRANIWDHIRKALFTIRKLSEDERVTIKYHLSEIRSVIEK